MTESEQRHFEVLLEDISGKLNLVLEGHETLDGKIERYHQEAKEDHCLAMDLIKGSHDDLNHKIDAVGQQLDTKIDGVETRLNVEIDGVEARLDAKIGGMHKELKETRKELSAGIQNVVEKVEGHENRILSLERKVA